MRKSFVLWHNFFFQAEDGIRDDLVTGVQTCALPIFRQETAEATAAMVRARPLAGTAFRTARGSRPGSRRVCDPIPDQRLSVAASASRSSSAYRTRGCRPAI